MDLNQVLALISASTFMLYGLVCLFTNHMKEEFKRYGLEKFRNLTALLEFLGGLGTLVGFKYSFFYILSTSGLALLMFFGLIVRLRLKDHFLQILPALLLMILNIYLVFSFI